MADRQHAPSKYNGIDALLCQQLITLVKLDYVLFKFMRIHTYVDFYHRSFFLACHLIKMHFLLTTAIKWRNPDVKTMEEEHYLAK